MKEKMIKKVSLTALSALFAVSLSMGVATLVDTTADGAVAQVFAGGAGVRVKYDEDTQTADTKNGIRFATYMQGVDKSDIKSSVTAIMPTDLLDGATLTVETDGAQVETTTDKWHAYTDKDHGEVLCAYAVLYDVPKVSYSREITWVTQVTLNDDTVLTMTPATRSLSSVAESAEANQAEENFTAGQLGILDEYQDVAEANTYLEIDAITLTAGENTAEINASPAFWSNYYKDLNTVSFSVTVDTAADLQSLTFTTENDEVINFPISGLQDGVAKQIPFDYQDGAFTKGTFTATLADGATSNVVIAPMKASAVETETVAEKYYYSREDKDLRLDYIDGISETADKVLAVKYEGEDVAFTLNTEKNRIVFAKDVLSKVEINSSNTIEVQTATTKYQMTKVAPFDKAFYEADDLFVTYDDGDTYYSYFDLTGDSTRWSKANRTDNKNNTVKNVPYVTGAYVLANDIDLSNDARVIRHKRSTRYGQDSPNDSAGKYSGLRGMFYGNGHTITGMTVGRGGLFGYVGYDGVIQNLSLKDVKFSQDTADNMTYVFGLYLYGGATLNNVYVSIKNIQKPKLESSTTDSTDFNDSYVLCLKLSTSVSITNVIVDMSAVGEVNVVGRGVFGKTTTADLAKMAENNRLKNFYVIGQAPLSISYTSRTVNSVKTYYAVIVDTANQNGTATWTGKQYAWIHSSYGGMKDCEEGDVTYTDATTDVYRFVDTDELKAHFDANAEKLQSFDSNYWDITTGVPVMQVHGI